MRFSLSARSKTHHDLGYFFPERGQRSSEFLHGSNHLFRPTEVVWSETLARRSLEYGLAEAVK